MKHPDVPLMISIFAQSILVQSTFVSVPTFSAAMIMMYADGEGWPASIQTERDPIAYLGLPSTQCCIAGSGNSI
jgi:hypothetical protein